MPISKYIIAKKLLTRLRSESGEILPFNTLRIEIIKNIGADDRRTVKPYIQLMLETELIIKEGDGEYVRINP